MDAIQLRRDRAAKIEELRQILEKATQQKRNLTDSEQQRYDRLVGEVEELAKQIARIENVRDLVADLDRPMGTSVFQQQGFGEPYISAAGTRGIGAPSGEWRSFGEQMMAVAQAGMPGGTSVVDSRLQRDTRAASGLSEGVPSDGGFLVHMDYAQDLYTRAYQTGLIASRVREFPMSNPMSNGLTIPAVDESSRANGSRWGGIRAYWEGEADEITATKPKFRKLELKLKKLTGLVYLTDELLQDASALGAFLGQAFASEFGFKLDDAFLNGDGAGKPMGIMNSPALVTVAKEDGQAADTVVFENAKNMWSRLWSRSRQNAVWHINQDVEPQLFGMSMAVGTGGVPVYMPAGGVSGQPFSTLFGRPIVPLEQCATVGDLGDIVLADWSEYLTIKKGAMEAVSSIHVRFLYDEMAMRFILRTDGQPGWSSALTPFSGSGNTLSPFVTLAAR